MYDVIIVGAGMAGMTSAIYVSRAGLSVLVLEAGAVGGQILGSLEIANWPGELQISGPDLIEKIYHQVNKLGVEVRYEEVEKIKKNRGGFMVSTDDDEYECKTVIIATGTAPRRLSDERTKEVGERPVSYCATCDGALYKGKPVVVIGSGNTAKHEIKYLEGICSKVYHIHHDEPIPPEAEAVFVATKRVPATEVVKNLVDLDESGYVKAGENCATSCPGVFVAGDVRIKDLRQLVTAAGDGAAAAEAVIDYLK